MYLYDYKMHKLCSLKGNIRLQQEVTFLLVVVVWKYISTNIHQHAVLEVSNLVVLYMQIGMIFEKYLFIVIFQNEDYDIN